MIHRILWAVEKKFLTTIFGTIRMSLLKPLLLMAVTQQKQHE
jgi:hypothetical protein